jgi:hypothetical protein
MKKSLIILPFLGVLFALSAIQSERFGQDIAGAGRRESGNLVKFEGGLGSSPWPAAWGRRPPRRS